MTGREFIEFDYPESDRVIGILTRYAVDPDDVEPGEVEGLIGSNYVARIEREYRDIRGDNIRWLSLIHMGERFVGVALRDDEEGEYVYVALKYGFLLLVKAALGSDV